MAGKNYVIEIEIKEYNPQPYLMFGIVQKNFKCDEHFYGKSFLYNIRFLFCTSYSINGDQFDLDKDVQVEFRTESVKLDHPTEMKKGDKCKLVVQVNFFFFFPFQNLK